MLITPAHVEYLRARGVSEETATANGVRSVSSASELTNLAPFPFASFQADHVPGLLFPLTGTTGEVVGHQYRPDAPRVVDGKPRKFENPKSQKIRLYVPREAQPLLASQDVPLVVTEGPVKGLATWSRLHLPPVVLTGVTAYLGREDRDSSTRYLPDWKDGVQMLDREVWIAFDSDVASNINVWSAAKSLHTYLTVNLRARVKFVRLPDDDNAKLGLDDFLATFDTVDDARNAVNALLQTRVPRKPSSRRAQVKFETAEAHTLPQTNLDTAEQWWSEQGIDEVRRVEREGTWVRYDGKRWQRDGTQETGLRQSVTSYLTGLYADARARAAAASGEEKKGLHDLSLSYASDVYQRQVIGVASRMSVMMVPSEHFDPPESKYLFTVANGTIDLPTGTLKQHSADDRLTGLSLTQYDATATCTEWEAFVNKIVPDDDTRRYLQRVIGMSLVGDPGTQGAWVISGSGGNGKGVFTRIISAVLGNDYATVIPRSVLQAGKRDEHPTQLMELRARRFALLDEFPEGGTFNVELFKEITGGGQIKARSMRQDFTQFRPTHTLFITTNHLPEVDATDQAMWRRLRHIIFPYAVPANEIDDQMESRILANEAPGILNWMLRGFADYWQNKDKGYGLGEPQEVVDATNAWRMGQDHMLQFAEECLVTDAQGGVLVTDVHAVYAKWCDQHDIKPWSRVTTLAFATELERRNFDVRRKYRHGGRNAKNGTWLIGRRLAREVAGVVQSEAEGTF